MPDNSHVMPAAAPLADRYDLVIVGSGGGSMCAALAAKDRGLSVVILEKLDKVGGSTGYSGGVWWVPNHPLLAAAGISDSIARGREYLSGLVTHQGPASSPARREAFLHAAPEMIRYLAGKGMKFRRPVHDWPDYYDELPGGEPAGRSLMAEHVDARVLGDWAERLSTYPPAKGFPLGADEVPTLLLVKRTMAGKLKALKFAAAMARDRLTGRRTLVNGAAIQGRMLRLALDAGIPIVTGYATTALVSTNGRVTGVTGTIGGREATVAATRGVLVNAGGFSRNPALRRRWGRAPDAPVSTNANPGDTGEMIEAMIALGAATDNLDTAWWVITSNATNGMWPKGSVAADGQVFPAMHHLDLSLPLSIMVDGTGRRFCNEAGSYMEIGERMYARHQETGKAIPAWVIFDAKHRKRYLWGPMAPGVTPPEWIESGYMKRADTLAALAAQCGIDAAGLADEIARFNANARNGVDPDFNRGARAFDRSHGDPTVKPNPSLAPIEDGPFYAVAMYPSDVGTAGGVVSDTRGRVLKDDSSAIPGLYATGNCTASVFGRSYPGAGASIAASFTFGWLAALDAAGAEDELSTLAA